MMFLGVAGMTILPLILPEPTTLVHVPQFDYRKRKDSYFSSAAAMDPAPTIDPPAAQARLLSLSRELLGTVSTDGAIRFVNPAWSTVLGLGEEDLLDATLLDLVHPDDRNRVARALEEVATGTLPDRFTCRVPRADGYVRSFEFSAQAGPEGDSIDLAGRDVTELLANQARVAGEAEKLERALAELQHFAYIASHDLTEPLRMVTSYLDLLERRYGDQLDDTAREFVGYAVGGAVRMRALIEDLLAFSRVGSHELHVDAVDLRELLGRVVEGTGRTVTEADGRIELAEPFAPVRGDSTQLALLLSHLIINALKFRAPDRPPLVTVSAGADGDGVRIDVADNGLGIPEIQQERIFKMFERLHGRDEYEGTGIGLALCRRIAERHDGRLGVASEPGVGSVFSVWLPR